MPSDISMLFIQLNFGKASLLLFVTGQSDSYFFNNLDKALDTYRNYDRALLSDYFNTEILGNVMDTFLSQNDIKNIMKDQTSFKNSINPSAIDLFLTNNSLAF